VIGGGRRASWPPDRPVEWWTFGLICGAVAALMLACLALPVWMNRKAKPGSRAAAGDPPGPAHSEPGP
jgi:hypothetical protein